MASLRSFTLPAVVFASIAMFSQSGFAQTPPSVSFTSLRVVPSPASGAVRSVFLRARGRFAACDSDGTAGSVTLTLQTDANGQVTVARRRHTSFNGDAGAVTACVIRTAEGLRFPNSVLGTLDISVTVRFTPAAPH